MTKNSVTEAAKRVESLTKEIAEIEATRADLSTTLRRLKRELKTANADHTQARAVALLALADDPAKFAAEAERLRESVASSVPAEAEPEALPEPAPASDQRADHGHHHWDNQGGGHYE